MAGGLAAHEEKTHGTRTAARSYVIDVRCPACGLDYGSRPRALRHLAYGSAACRALMLQGQLMPQPPELVAAADEADRPVLREAGRLGISCCRATTPGPKQGACRKALAQLAMQAAAAREDEDESSA